MRQDCSKTGDCRDGDVAGGIDGRLSRRLPGGHDREVDVGLGDLVDVVRPGVKRDMQHDLDHLGVVVTGKLDGTDIIVAHMAALAGDLGSKAYGRVRLASP